METYCDPIGRKDYRLYHCTSCTITFAEPRASPGAEWYARAHTGEDQVYLRDWRYETFFREALPGKLLLDVGCGIGRFLILARDRGFQAHGVDFNPAYIDQAKMAGLENVWAMDFDAFFGRQKRSYDVVTLFDVLEHLPEPVVFLTHLKRALRPGGSLVLTVPNGARPVPSRGFREQFDFPPYHFTRWTAIGLERALQKAGFQVVRIESSSLHCGFFSGLLYYRLLNGLFPCLKRWLLGARPDQSNQTWTDLLGATGSSNAGKKSFWKKHLSDPDVRQRMTDLGYRWFARLLWPIEAPLVFVWQRLHPDKGRTLYLIAVCPG